MTFKTIFSACFFLLFGLVLRGQTINIEEKIDWTESSFIEDHVTEVNNLRLSCSSCDFGHTNPYLPTISKRFPVSGNGQLKIIIEDISFLNQSPFFNINETEYKNKVIGDLNNKLEIANSVDQNRNMYYGKIFFTPILKDEFNQLLFVQSVKFRVTFISKPKLVNKNPPKNNSVLREGDIYKFKINSTGIQKITGASLKNDLKIDIQNVDLSKIQIFTNPGGHLPFLASANRPDDLIEQSIFIKGAENNKLDESDAIYFYAEGAEVWENGEENLFVFNDNPFETENYAFLRLGADNGKRVLSSGNFISDVNSIETYLEKERYELNALNLLEENFGTLGTGQQWFGETFDLNKIQNFQNKFKLNNIVPQSTANISVRFAGRASSSSKVQVKIDGSTFSKNINSISLASYTSSYAQIANFNEDFTLSSNNPIIEIDYSQNSSAIGWLDYIEIQYMRKLILDENQLIFTTKNVSETGQYNFVISNTDGNDLIWDITNFGSPFQKKTNLTGNKTAISVEDSEYRKYIIFDQESNLIQPKFIEKIANQNLHSAVNYDMALIAHSSLLSEANRLMDHRIKNDGYSIILVTTDQIYNEFSSGRQDPTAIRDFLKMLYDRNPNFKFGLLFGNGSFDYKGIKYDRSKTSLVPVFETELALDPIRNFPSDDFYSLLDDQEGNSLLGEVDLAIGRIPVGNLAQAKTVVDKIIKYDTDPTLHGPWNLRSVFTADDEDSNAHINPADAISEDFLEKNPDINLNKIYWDAYKQLSLPGGERYPDVTDEIKASLFNGALTLCYLGHGGPSGWGQERVLQVTDIDNWSNERSFPLFITATCSFASYDDPSVFSAGEKVIVNEHGGIGLFTTSRAVYASDNTRLTQSVFDFIVTEENNELLALGEILRRSKNNNSNDTINVNARKFLLLGDPSMKLLYPQYEVVTSSINGIDVTQNEFTDTIRALSQMSITGYISDGTEILSDYNGEINVTVFDKRTIRKTLGQDPRSKIKEFYAQKNLLFTGRAKVLNGEFSLEFIIPKDIIYNVGQGKISYYATDFKRDAKGSFSNFLVGGSSNISINDDTPPIVQVFLNNEEFVSGGITNENPILYAKISDDYGINLSGSSVGHDLTGNLDDNTQKSYFLNDFFESELNNFKNGVVKYPLNNLENGSHKISVRAWDVANNVGEGFTEFIVSDNLKDGLSHVLNYPNPFSDNTCFMFEHNFSADVLDVEINIYTVTGKLVKTVLHNTVSDGYRVSNIKWDGNDDFGSTLGKGVYLYKIKVKANVQNIIKESGFEKLVILK